MNYREPTRLDKVLTLIVLMVLSLIIWGVIVALETMARMMDESGITRSVMEILHIPLLAKMASEAVAAVETTLGPLIIPAYIFVTLIGITIAAQYIDEPRTY